MRLCNLGMWAAAVSLVGCTAFTESEEEFINSTDLIPRSELDSPPVLLAADLQVHFIYNEIDTRTNVVNRFSESIRPVAADYFAPIHFNRFLRDFKNDYPDARTIILGDALDVSCDWEAKKFFGILKDKANWTMAPGNHDFIFLGTHERKEREDDWISGCSEPDQEDGRFNKAEFIFTYMEALANQAKLPDADPSYAAFAACFDQVSKDRSIVHPCLHRMAMQSGHGDDENCAAVVVLGNDWVNCKKATFIPERFAQVPNQGWWKNPDPDGFLQDIFWYINPTDTDNSEYENAYAYSFILQRLRLPDGRLALLLDTNNPARMRSVINYPVGYNPANSANMLYIQMNAASFLMGGDRIFVQEGEETDSYPSSNEGEHVIMSHHPVDNFRFEAKKGLCMLLDVGNVNTMVTAHTHHPSKTLYDSFLWQRSCRPLQEYNIGSMIDAPLNYLVLGKAAGEIVPQSINLSLEYSELCANTPPEWNHPYSSPVHYTAYSRLGFLTTYQEIHRSLMRTLVSHYIQMLNPDWGFETISNTWIPGVTSDKQLRDELENMERAISDGKELSPFKQRFLELDEFFAKRTVSDSAALDKYVRCQLHWASEAKEAL